MSHILRRFYDEDPSISKYDCLMKSDFVVGNVMNKGNLMTQLMITLLMMVDDSIMRQYG